MTKKETELVNSFAFNICKDLKIIEAIEYLKREAINSLQGEYGDAGNGFGTEEYSVLYIYAHEKFDWWFEKNLDKSQKSKLLELSEDDKFFEINIYSHNRRNLVLDFLIKLKRTSIDATTHLHIHIDFPDIDEDAYEIRAEMYGQISDDEVSEMLMMYELKR